MDQIKTTSIDGPEQLGELAHSLLTFAGNGRFFIFEGDMGAGKTTFIKAVCNALGVSDVVSSPTFSIVNLYDSPAGVIYHFDFYRLKTLQEAYDIGYEEYFYSNAVCLVEWPQKVADLLPEDYVKIEIRITGETSRDFTFRKVTMSH